ncbi:MAG: hypothetical protein KAI99_06965 [Cyclobacteriaceae bacterium]|nr:hypothetical protein [Cyclobacteriaceae bacterium]
MRITIISTSRIKTYKTIALSIVTVITLLVIVGALYRSIGFEEYNLLIIVPVYVILAYRAIPAIVKIKNVSYDDSSVYYDKKGFEVQVPFEDIKDIEIKTISGIYKINLFDPSQDGSSIMFKTSLWYPFNFKKQDEKVNELRDKIDNYKKRIWQDDNAQLPSYTITSDNGGFKK